MSRIPAVSIALALSLSIAQADDHAAHENHR